VLDTNQLHAKLGVSFFTGQASSSYVCILDCNICSKVNSS